jgi:hypothetical protein
MPREVIPSMLLRELLLKYDKRCQRWERFKAWLRMFWRGK